MAVTDCIRQCRRCDASFVRTAKGQPTKYCSAACRDRRPTKVRTPRPIRPPRNRKGRVRGKKALTCAGCGREAHRTVGSRDAGRFCSRECFASHIGRVAQERAALRRIAKNWAWRPSKIVLDEVAALARIARYVERPRLTRRPCIGCGCSVVGVYERRRACTACKLDRKRAQVRAAKKTAKGRQRKRIDKAKRRAVERGATAHRIDPLDVFARDSWKCQLCGIATPRRLRGQMVDAAPELDHIVPLAVGGQHVWANVQCACRKCNGLKGAKSMGQLHLGLAA